MIKKQTIPIPDKSGSSGEQLAAENKFALQESGPLEGLPMARTINGLASTHSRSLGGEVTSALIAGATTQLACDYQELKEKYTILSGKYESQRDKLEKTRTGKAILAERIRSDRENKHLRNLCITIGTSLIGIGFSFSSTNLDKYSYGAYGFGVLLFSFGWISGPKEAKK